MKKACLILSLLFTFAFAFASFSSVVCAEEQTEKEYFSLEELAEDYLVKVTRIDKDGIATVELRNIPQFVEKAHEVFPELDDIIIARFLYKYSDQSEKPETLPDEVVLEILTSQENTSQTEMPGAQNNETVSTEKESPGTTKIIFGIAIGVLIVVGAILVIKKQNK